MISGSQLLGDAYVNIMGETSKLEQTLSRSMSMVEGAVRNLGKTLAVGIGAAIAGAVGTGVAGVWMWAKEEQTVKDLESSIRMLGGSVEELVPKYEKVMAQIQQNTRIGDTASRSAMAYAASLGAPVDRLDELAILASGMAERMGIDIRSAMRYLVMGIESADFTMLRRYIPALRTATTAQEQLNIVLAYGREGFEKAGDMADTLTGRLTQLQNNFGDLMEKIGEKIAERFQLKEIVDEISKRMYRIVQVFNQVVDSIKPGEINLQKIGDRFESIVKSIMAVTMALPGMVQTLRKGSDFGNILKTLWEAVKNSASLFVEIIKGGFYALTPIFEGLVKIVEQKIRSSLSQITIMGKPIMEPAVEVPEEIIMRGALLKAGSRWEDQKEDIEKQWEEVWAAVKDTASDETKGVVDGIIEAYRSSKEKLDKLFGGASLTEDRPELGDRPWNMKGPLAQQGLGSQQITGVADFWRTMQMGQQKDEQAELVREQLREQVLMNTGIQGSLNRLQEIRDFIAMGASPQFGPVLTTGS